MCVEVSVDQSRMAMTKQDGDEGAFGHQQVKNMQEEVDEEAEIQVNMDNQL